MKIFTKFFLSFLFAIIFSNNLCGMELGTEIQDDEKVSYDMKNKFSKNEIVVVTRSTGKKVYGKITEIDDKKVYTITYDEEDPSIVKYYKFYKYYDEENPKLDQKKEPITGKSYDVYPLSELGKLEEIIPASIKAKPKSLIGTKASVSDLESILSNPKSKSDTNEFKIDELVVVERNDGALRYGTIAKKLSGGKYNVDVEEEETRIYHPKAVFEATGDFDTTSSYKKASLDDLEEGTEVIVKRSSGELVKGIFKEKIEEKAKITLSPGRTREYLGGEIYKLGLKPTASDNEKKAALEREKKATLEKHDYSTLTKWAAACFSAYPEYSSQMKVYPDPILTWKQLSIIIDLFIKTFEKEDFYNQALWVDGKAPKPSEFLQETSKRQFLKYVELLSQIKELKKSDPKTDKEKEERAKIYKKAYEAQREIQSLDNIYPYVQKKIVPPGSTVCFIGDLHGSIHSLLRNLLRLVAAGYLNDNFSIAQKNFYMVFNGDFTDRGLHGVEVWFTLMLLKIQNPKNVFLLKGNHEEFVIAYDNGFESELRSKYAKDPGYSFSLVTKLYRFLPFALYLGSGNDFVQCCHGGIEIRFNPEKLLLSNKIFQNIGFWNKEYEPRDLDEKTFKKLHEEEGIDTFHDSKGELHACLCDTNYEGFNWSDFEQASTNGKIILNKRGAGYIADVAATNKYLGINKLIKAFFRGHQDKRRGFKMLFSEDTDTESIPDNAKLTPYPNGPYIWKAVVNDDKDITENGFLIYKYTPVFTFTSATETQQVPHDCFGILTIGDGFKKWRLKPCESEKLPVDRDGQFVTVTYETGQPKYERISVTFGKKAQSIPAGLIKLAKSLPAVKDKDEEPGRSPVSDLSDLIDALETLKAKLKKLSTALKK